MFGWMLRIPDWPKKRANFPAEHAIQMLCTPKNSWPPNFILKTTLALVAPLCQPSHPGKQQNFVRNLHDHRCKWETQDLCCLAFVFVSQVKKDVRATALLQNYRAVYALWKDEQEKCVRVVCENGKVSRVCIKFLFLWNGMDQPFRSLKRNNLFAIIIGVVLVVKKTRPTSIAVIGHSHSEPSIFMWTEWRETSVW